MFAMEWESLSVFDHVFRLKAALSVFNTLWPINTIWHHQAITWTNLDISSVTFSDNHKSIISQKYHSHQLLKFTAELLIQNFI